LCDGDHRQVSRFVPARQNPNSKSGEVKKGTGRKK
jgi:hypothetical protein